MRVTFNALHSGLDAINVAAEQFVEAQWQTSTGKRLRFLRTDPAAAERAVVERAELSAIDSYSKAGSAATSRLGMLDTTLGDILEQITRGTVAASSGRSGAASPTTRAAAAMTLRGVRDAVAYDVNGRADGRYVFSGSSSDAQPYQFIAGAWVYQGDATDVTAEVARGRRVLRTMDGERILRGTDTADLLTVLDALAVAVDAGDAAAIDVGLAALERAFARVSRAQSQVGIDQVSTQESADRWLDLKVASQTRLSKHEDADMAEAITRMTNARTAYEAALGAVGASTQRSLLDYLP
jgi:flagellar hook-associated protein 3 FlgL